MTLQEIKQLVSEYGAESYSGGLPGREYVAYDVLIAAIREVVEERDRAIKRLKTQEPK